MDTPRLVQHADCAPLTQWSGASDPCLALLACAQAAPTQHALTSKHMQDFCTCLERCPKPVLAAVHGACVGAGVDLITAADVRLCAPSAKFCVKEVDLAITADLGTLQRLPTLVGEGRARDLALSARTIDAQTALAYGLVTRVCESDSKFEADAVALAAQLAKKPRLALMGTKRIMLQGRGKRVEDGLTDVAVWNAAMLWSHELQQTVARLQHRAKL